MSRITNREELTLALKFHHRGAPAPRLIVPGLQPGVVISIGELDGRAHLTIDATGPTDPDDLAEFLHMVSHAIQDSEVVGTPEGRPVKGNPQA